MKRSWLRPISDPRMVATVKRRHLMIEKFGDPEEWRCSFNSLDWIIKGVQGEFYPCKPDIFDAIYEIVPLGDQE